IDGSAVAKSVVATFYLSTSTVASAPIQCLRRQGRWSFGLRVRKPEWDSTRDLCQRRHKARAQVFNNWFINPYALVRSCRMVGIVQGSKRVACHNAKGTGS